MLLCVRARVCACLFSLPSLTAPSFGSRIPAVWGWVRVLCKNTSALHCWAISSPTASSLPFGPQWDLDWFCNLGSMSGAAVNRVPFWYWAMCLDTTNYMLESTFIFLYRGTSVLASIVSRLICIPTNTVWTSLSASLLMGFLFFNNAGLLFVFLSSLCSLDMSPVGWMAGTLL